MKKKKKFGLNSLKKLERKIVKPGVTIGRPIADKPEHLGNFQVNKLFETLAVKGYNVDPYDLWHPAGSSIAAQARNMIVDTFLARDGVNKPRHEYLLFIDDDQCFPQDYDPFEAFEMLIDANKDIIGAMTVRKFPPYRLNASMFSHGGMRHIGWWPEDKPFKVHQLGFGMVLIKRRVIEDLYHMTDPPTPLFSNPLQYNPMVKEVELRGEDYLFCVNALKLGYDIWVEPRIPLLHIGWYPFGVDNFKAYRDEVAKHEGMLDLCQDTDFYAPLAEALRKSGRRSKKGRENLYDVASAEADRLGIIEESKSQPTATTPPDATPKQT